jgi:hypothetical protein
MRECRQFTLGPTTQLRLLSLAQMRSEKFSAAPAARADGVGVTHDVERAVVAEQMIELGMLCQFVETLQVDENNRRAFSGVVLIR